MTTTNKTPNIHSAATCDRYAEIAHAIQCRRSRRARQHEASYTDLATHYDRAAKANAERDSAMVALNRLRMSGALTRYVERQA